MDGAAEGEGEQWLPGGSQRCPKDLLRRFSGTLFRHEETGAEEDSGEVELSLGLSLGGCFGADPARRKGLQRSSSVAVVPVPHRAGEAPAAPASLKRTSSLPAAVEEEERKRKELQRVGAEAKRMKPGSGQAWRGDLTASTEGRGGFDGPAVGWWAPGGHTAAAVSPGSGGSQGSSSSGVSDSGGRPLKREELMHDGSGQWRSSLRIQALPCLVDHSTLGARKPMNHAVKRQEEMQEDSQNKGPVVTCSNGRNRVSGILEDMPCVSTSGTGPNGRKVEGFLYSYGKGEEVSIMCVCHGHFLSPAEFVQHAGGEDVVHPLKHIIVDPSSLL